MLLSNSRSVCAQVFDDLCDGLARSTCGSNLASLRGHPIPSRRRPGLAIIPVNMTRRISGNPGSTRRAFGRREQLGHSAWGHFGHLVIGRARRPLMAFVMVLSYSRQIFLRLFLDARMESFLRGHVTAFTAWNGCARVLLYDNLKSAVLERQGDAIRFHPTLIAFAGNYRYEPRPVAVARGNEKGRVERAIRYLRDNFFAARIFADLDDLNVQAETWCRGMAADRRCPGQDTLSVREAFASEAPRLLTLTVLADPNEVRIADGAQVLSCHRRSYDKGAQIEDAAHVQALVEHKRVATAAPTTSQRWRRKARPCSCTPPSAATISEPLPPPCCGCWSVTEPPCLTPPSARRSRAECLIPMRCGSHSITAASCATRHRPSPSFCPSMSGRAMPACSRTASIRGRGGSTPNRRGGWPNETQRQNFFSAVSRRC